LLSRYDAATHFLTSPPAALAARLVAEGREPGGDGRYVGRRVGAYRIVRQVGRGGMARVFLAERADGQFEHRVALKLLRPGFDSKLGECGRRSRRRSRAPAFVSGAFAAYCVEPKLRGAALDARCGG